MKDAGDAVSSIGGAYTAKYGYLMAQGEVMTAKSDFYEFRENGSRGFAVLSGRDSISFEEIEKRTFKLAHILRTLGIDEGVRAGMFLGNGPEFVTSLLALSKNKSSAVLFSTYFKPRELQDYFERTHVRFLISDEKHANAVQSLPLEKVLVHAEDGFSWGGLQIWRMNNPGEDGASAAGDNWLDKEFVLKFTSGVNGKSKIVPKTYGNVADEVMNFSRTISLGGNDVVICPAPLFHSYGLIDGFLSSFHSGAKLVLMDKFIPNDFITLVEKTKATIFIGVPFMYQLLCLTYLNRAPDFSSLRYCFSAGAKISEETANNYEARFGRRINQLYGSTETGVISVNLYKDGFSDVNSAGQPVEGRVIEVVDEEGNEVKRGTAGEIKVKSEGAAKGYLDHDEPGHKAFSNGWYHTNDIGYLSDDGNLYVTGRKSAFINVAGLKVDPFEVEKVLMLHDAVSECAVVGVAEPHCGEAVQAYVVAIGKPAPMEIILFCKERLADYKVPQNIRFVDELPKSPTGKILRKYLAG
ncbi:MAG: acyl--CoA ligase [Nitrospinae bacterium]|nr:acyl--CoA ligase [Nitrospinota bacterium]